MQSVHRKRLYSYFIPNIYATVEIILPFLGKGKGQLIIFTLFKCLSYANTEILLSNLGGGGRRDNALQYLFYISKDLNENPYYWCDLQAIHNY